MQIKRGRGGEKECDSVKTACCVEYLLKPFLERGQGLVKRQKEKQQTQTEMQQVSAECVCVWEMLEKACAALSHALTSHGPIIKQWFWERNPLITDN